jgi:spore coat polysaccharide biosynthesis protein SpsF
MIAVIIQARMGSTRLPGKVLKQIGGRPMLSYQIERLRNVVLADKIIVATTTRPGDDAIESFCRGENIECTRGSEDDVLSRYYEAAEKFNAHTVVRITSDCPLIESSLVDLAIGTFQSSPTCDYLSNMIAPSWPYGMAVEVVAETALREANLQSNDPREREHVTPFIYWRPDRYRLRSLIMTPDLSSCRWTVDTPEDFDLISRIISALYPIKPRFGLGDILEFLKEKPELELINRHVAQKLVKKPVSN